MKEQVETLAVVSAEMLDHGLGDVQLAVEHRGRMGAVGQRQAEIQGVEADLIVVARAQRAPRVAVDGHAQDAPTLPLRERRDVRASTGKAEAKWRLGSDQHVDLRARAATIGRGSSSTAR